MKTSHAITVYTVLLLAALPVGSTQIYTWIDDRGITNFSESPPGDDSISVEQLEILPPPSAGNTTDENFYSVVNQANRMETRRLENMKIRAERQQAEAETKRAAAEARAIKQDPYQDNNNARYYPAYPVIPRYGYGQPGYGRPGYKYPAHQPAHRPSHIRHRSPSVSLGHVSR